MLTLPSALTVWFSALMFCGLSGGNGSVVNRKKNVHFRSLNLITFDCTLFMWPIAIESEGSPHKPERDANQELMETARTMKTEVF